MNESYVSLKRPGEGTYEEKKSIFLGFAIPVSREEEALRHLSEIKSKYPDARHHVYAYILREGNKLRYSDDGEPSGTGGMPVLDALRKAGITDSLVVVVRYFGGILLGTGGLVHAYTTAAKAAIEDAEPVKYRPMVELEVTVSYADHKKLESVLSHYTVSDTAFSHHVVVRVLVEEAQEAIFRDAVITMTAGRGIIKTLENKYSY